jgi:hypothetical protein
MDLIRLILAGFGIFAYTIYSHHSLILISNIHTNLHTNIQFDANKYKLKEIFVTERICASTFSHTDKYLLRKIFILTQIFTKFQANFTFKRIIARKYLYTSEYCLKLYRKTFHKSQASINIRFFFKLFASLSFKIFALKQNK